MLITIFLGGCTEQTVIAERGLAYLSLSNDGSILVSTTDPFLSGSEEGTDFQIWNVTSGEIILQDFPSENYYADISPNGNFFVVEYKNYDGVYNVSDGEKIVNTTTYDSYWSVNEKLFVNIDSPYERGYTKIDIWDMKKLSINRTIDLSMESDSAVLSPDGAQLALFRLEKSYFSVSIIDLFSESNNIIWDKKFVNSGGPDSLQWSEDNKIGFFYENKTDDKKHLMLLDPKNGSILYDSSVTQEWTKALLSPNCKRYILLNLEDRPTQSIRIFNLSGLERTIKIDACDVGNVYPIIWSYDSNLICFGDMDGKITILDASTGKIIKTLKTPVRKDTYPAPGFEIVLILFAVSIILFIIKNKK